MTEGMTVTSLVASLQHKASVATVCPSQIVLDKKIITYRLCQIALNWTLSRKFEEWCKFKLH